MSLEKLRATCTTGGPECEGALIRYLRAEGMLAAAWMVEALVERVGEAEAKAEELEAKVNSGIVEGSDEYDRLYKVDGAFDDLISAWKIEGSYWPNASAESGACVMAMCDDLKAGHQARFEAEEKERRDGPNA